MKIPPIIHQTWKDHNVPNSFIEMANTWINLHPGWEYRLWTDEMNRNFIKEKFPYFLHKYDNYPSNIQRVDAVRYFALYTYGGIYVDMDFECLRNITLLIENTGCVFGKEPEDHCIIHQKNMIISNAFMACIPQHPFFQSLCSELGNDFPVTDHPNDRVLETTGPFMLSRKYNSYNRKETIRLLESDLIYPLTKEELLNDTPAIRQKLAAAYAVHHYAGTWWKKNYSTAKGTNEYK